MTAIPKSRIARIRRTVSGITTFTPHSSKAARRQFLEAEKRKQAERIFTKRYSDVDAFMAREKISPDSEFGKYLLRYKTEKSPEKPFFVKDIIFYAQQSGDPNTVPFLLNFVFSDWASPHERVRAMNVLCYFPKINRFFHSFKRLTNQSQDIYILVAAINVLANMNDRRAIPIFEKNLNSTHELIWTAAARGLARFPSRRVLMLLLKEFGHSKNIIVSFSGQQDLINSVAEVMHGLHLRRQFDSYMGELPSLLDSPARKIILAGTRADLHGRQAQSFQSLYGLQKYYDCAAGSVNAYGQNFAIH